VGAHDIRDRPDKLGMIYHVTEDLVVKAFEGHPFARYRDRNIAILNEYSRRGYAVTVTCAR
jgi:hypothetical protein